MGQSWPLFVYFRSFHIPIQMTNINWKKHRWCAWDSNPGRQNGRRRRIHWAMAAPLSYSASLSLSFIYSLSRNVLSHCLSLFHTHYLPLFNILYSFSLFHTHSLYFSLWYIILLTLSFANSLSLSSLILSVIHTHSLSLYLTYSLLLSLSLLFTHSSRRGHREAQTRCGP